MILAGDIGGTNTRLAIFDGSLRMKRIHVFHSNDFDSLEDPLGKFVREAGARVTHACFGIAGPVVRGRAKTTNLRWVVDAKSVAKALKLDAPRVKLINDLQANAAGIALLRAKDLLTLNRGQKRDGNRAIIAAGTGLGEAGLYWDGNSHQAVASEGGHASFGPTSAQEDRLLEFLRGRGREKFNGHVSWERVLSGRGLARIFEFLTYEHAGRASEEVLRQITSIDAPRAISTAAMNGTCPRSEAALEIFVRCYGAEAGNLALKFLAVGGLYVGGGIAPKIAAKLKSPTFLSAFVEKGPMKPLMQSMPVHVILNDKTALMGAARVASEM